MRVKRIVATVLSAIKQPDESVIKAHLEMIFAPVREEYPGGVIELRYGSTSLSNIAYFGVAPERIAEAAAFAANRNREGNNVYFGVNPRKSSVDTRRAASAADVEIAFWHFADIDDAEAVKHAVERVAALKPSFTVTTGTSPHKRPHLYWLLDEPVRNLAAWTERQRGIAQAVEGDSVIDPPRIMRLAGTVNFPPQHKLQRGYGVEVVTMRTQFAEERGPVSPEQVAVSFPVQDRALQVSTPAAGQTTLSAMRRTQIGDLLDACRSGGQWHNTMIRLVAHMASVGRTSAEILALAEHITLPGYTVDHTRREMETALVGARVKYGTPEPEENVEAEEVDDFAPTPWVAMDPTKIPPREWLFGDILARKFVSVLVAPPGVGKSILTIEVAVAVATKRVLGPFKAHERANVWLFNNEDPREELDRRISAVLIANDIGADEINGRMFVDCGEERHLMVAKYDQNGNVMRMPVVDKMIEHIKRNDIGLLIVDPFIETHGVNENNNNDINIVARLYREIAQKTGCAVWLVHHTRKTPAGAIAGAPGDSEAGRGASSLGGVARFTATLFNMSKKDAEDLGIDDNQRHLYIRFDDGKANLKLNTGEGVWWRKASISLDNPRGFRPADSMGVLEWVDMAQVSVAKSERHREQWAVLGVALCHQMEAGQDITINTATKLLEHAGADVGLTSPRAIERALQDALSVPKMVGAWKLSYVKERRGNGSNWISKVEAASWSN